MKDLKQKPIDNSVGSETILWYNKGWNDAVEVCHQRIRELKEVNMDLYEVLEKIRYDCDDDLSGLAKLFIDASLERARRLESSQ